MSVEYVLHHWINNVALLHKGHFVWQWNWQHPSTNLLHFSIYKLLIHPCYKHWNSMEVFHCKLFCVPSAWTGFDCTWSPVQQRCIRWKRRQSCSSFCARFISLLPFFSYWLVSVSENPENNSRCDIAYRRLFFYYRLAHGPAYTRNTDGRLLELHCSMFLQGLLMFFIHHLSNFDASFACMPLL